MNCIPLKNTFVHYDEKEIDDESPAALPARRCRTDGAYPSEFDTPDAQTPSGCSTPVFVVASEVQSASGENISFCALASLDESPAVPGQYYFSGAQTEGAQTASSASAVRGPQIEGFALKKPSGCCGLVSLDETPADPANDYFIGAENSSGTTAAQGDQTEEVGLRTPSGCSSTPSQSLDLMLNPHGQRNIPVKNTFIHYGNEDLLVPPEPLNEMRRCCTAPADAKPTYLSDSATSGLTDDAPTFESMPSLGAPSSFTSMDEPAASADAPISQSMPPVGGPNSSAAMVAAPSSLTVQGCEPSSLMFLNDTFVPQAMPMYPWSMVGNTWNDQNAMMSPYPCWFMPYDQLMQGAAPSDMAAGSNIRATGSNWDLPRQTLVAASQPLEPLVIEECSERGTTWIRWTLPGSKLKSGDQKAVSLPFELLLGSGCREKFKLMLFPKVSFDGKGGRSFKKSKGKGYLQLKCEADSVSAGSTIMFRFYVDGQRAASSCMVTHDFSKHAVCAMPKDEFFDLAQCIINGRLEVGIEVEASSERL